MSHPCRALGYRQKEDPRDLKYPLDAIMGTSLQKPISKVWKPARVTNQGTESSCVGHTCWKLPGSEPMVRTIDLTPSQIYVRAKDRDEWSGTDYEGTSIRAGLSVLKEDGIIHSYHWSNGFDDALEYLLKRGDAGGPLAIGIRWTQSMFFPSAKGVISPSGNRGGGHALLWYAANWKTQMATLRNSWGEQWGMAGDCQISFKDLKKLLSEPGACAAAVVEQ